MAIPLIAPKIRKILLGRGKKREKWGPYIGVFTREPVLKAENGFLDVKKIREILSLGLIGSARREVQKPMAKSKAIRDWLAPEGVGGKLVGVSRHNAPNLGEDNKSQAGYRFRLRNSDRPKRRKPKLNKDF